MKRLIDKLRHYHSLTGEEYANLLSCQDTGTLLYLQQQAREVTLAHFGNGIFIRGLIEVSNRCRNNCHYCGIRKGNTAITRYALKRETILECCREGYALGFRTFVMQGGEDPALTDEWIEKTVAAIHCEFPDCAITLSLGEKSREAYERFFRAIITSCFHKTIVKTFLIIQCLHVFHVFYYHQGNLKGNRIFKDTQIQSSAFLQLIQSVHQSISVYK